MSKAILYDATMCIDCKLCEKAGAERNHLPYNDEIAAEEKMSPHKLTYGKTKGDKFMRRLCMNYEDPTCASVCPTAALLLTPRIRQTAGGLYLCSVLVLLGFVTNRLNVSITGMEAAARVRYIPKWTEFAVTASIIGAGFTIFALAVKYLPIFPEGAKRRDAPPAAPSAVGEEQLGVAGL